MIYIEKLKIVNQTYRGTDVLLKDFEINCSDVNLLVGNQGCGKSTILKFINKITKLTHADLYR